MKLNAHLLISPSFRLIQRVGGDGSAPSVCVLGVRSTPSCRSELQKAAAQPHPRQKRHHDSTRTVLNKKKILSPTGHSKNTREIFCAAGTKVLKMC